MKNRYEYVIKRRADAYKRKYERALRVFDDKAICTVEYKLRKDTFEITCYLTYKDERFRVDIEHAHQERIIDVNTIRVIVWGELQWAYAERQKMHAGLPHEPC